MIERVVIKNVPCIVWDDGDDFYVEYMLKSFQSVSDLEHTNKTMGFRGKGVVKDYETIKWS